MGGGRGERREEKGRKGEKKGRRGIFFDRDSSSEERKKLVMSLSVTEAVDVATCDRFMLEGRKLGQSTMEQRR